MRGSDMQPVIDSAAYIAEVNVSADWKIRESMIECLKKKQIGGFIARTYEEKIIYSYFGIMCSHYCIFSNDSGCC